MKRSLKFVLSSIFVIFITLSIPTQCYDAIAQCNDKDKDDIVFTEENTVSLRGPVDDVTVPTAIKQIYSKGKGKKIYLFLDTPGGYVDYGKTLVHVLMNPNLNITCVVNSAYSMGFVLMQACKERIVLPFSSTMQHVIWYGVRGQSPNNRSYVRRVDREEQLLNSMQAKRIGIELPRFNQLVRNDWWLDGDDIVKNKVADRVVTKISCDEKLTDLSESYDYDFLIAKLSITYSKCPLVVQPTSMYVSFNERGSDFDKNVVLHEIKEKQLAHTNHKEWITRQSNSAVSPKRALDH